MARQKYVELVLTDSDSRLESIPNHALNGYKLVSDYRADGKRHLFLRKSETRWDGTNLAIHRISGCCSMPR
jgi:hypothetical protein